MAIPLGGGNTPGMMLPDLGGWGFFAAGDPWITDISAAPVHPRSTAMLMAMCVDGQGNPCSSKLHFNGGDGSTTGNGFPYMVVPESQPLVPVDYDPTYGLVGFDGQTQAPIPANAAVEVVPYGGTIPPAQDGNDRHMIVVVRDDTTGGVKWVYELYSIIKPGAGRWQVSRFVVRYPGTSRFDDRPEGYPTTTAGGTRLLPGLVTYHDLDRAVRAGGDLGHALRIGCTFLRGQFVPPARLAAGYAYNPDSDVFPCGTRLRVKAGLDLSGYSPAVQALVRTGQRYGFIADDATGSGPQNFQLQGTMDGHWGQPYAAPYFDCPAFDVVEHCEVLDVPKGFTVAGAATGLPAAPATFTISLTGLPAHIEAARPTGLAPVAYLDPALTVPGGGSFEPYHAVFDSSSPASLAPQTLVFRPSGADGPRYIRWTNPTPVPRVEPPVSVYQVGSAPTPPPQPPPTPPPLPPFGPVLGRFHLLYRAVIMTFPYAPAEFPDRADVLKVVPGQSGGIGTRKEVTTPMVTAAPCSIQEFAPVDLAIALGAIGAQETAIAYFPREVLDYVPVPGDRVRDVATGTMFTVVRSIDEAGAGLLWAIHLKNTV